MNHLEIYTDGAYSPMRGQGGVGLVFISNNNIIYKWNKCLKNTTNNRCELYAVIKALQSISRNIEKITIYSDSQYVIGTICNNWNKKKNQDLWKLFDKMLDKAERLCPDISFVWIKGHSDNKFNIIADKLAVEASQEHFN